jgi:uncharacterized protein YqgV (UPF0045/DUF77 family)
VHLSVQEYHFRFIQIRKKAIKVVENSGMRYMVTPMGTIMEGDSLDELLEVVKKSP